MNHWGRWENRSNSLKHHPLNQGEKQRISEAWVNAFFSVQVSFEESAWGKITHLWVRRHDKQPVNWRDMQRIKNELAGEQTVGVEVYPAQTDVVDQANIYHIWCMPEGFALPFGLHLTPDVQSE